MPIRKTPIVTGEIYHVFNRGVARAPIFNTKRAYWRFIKTIDYYRFSGNALRFSYFLVLSLEEQQSIRENLKRQNQKLVDILCYCLMPNHFHIIMRQGAENGISTFMRKACDSYTRYFNLKNKRVGPLLQGNFKAVRVETDEQLIHLSRYVHINTYVNHVVKRDELTTYPFSSLPEYLGFESNSAFINKELILNYFRTPKEYEKFIFAEGDYKITQQNVGHLTLE